jgi:hypothetical protein
VRGEISLLPPNLHPFLDHSGVCITSNDSILTNVSNTANEHAVQHPTDAGTLENIEEISPNGEENSRNGQVSHHFMQDATRLADTPSALGHALGPGTVGDRSTTPRLRVPVWDQSQDLPVHIFIWLVECSYILLCE